MQFNQVNKNISKNRSDMSELQNQAATQKKVNKPSDDPLGAARVLSVRTEERGNSQFIKNINSAKSFLEFSDQSLGELSEILIRAKELAIGQSSDAGANSESRRATAEEVAQMFQQSVNIGNRKLGERYIFGGFKTQTMPFDREGEYFGDDGDMQIQTHKDSFVAMNIPGSKVFNGIGLNEDGVARPGVLDPRTVDELQDVRRKEQEARELQNQKDLNSIETRGPASAFNPSKMGSADPVTKERGVNIFQTLKGLEISLKSNDKVGVQNTLDFLDQAISQVVMARAEVGSRIMSVNNVTDTLQKAIVDNKIAASQLEDSDVFQLVSEINKADSALKATLDTSGKMIQPSLLDFLK